MGVKGTRFNIRSNWWNSYVTGKSKSYDTGQISSEIFQEDVGVSGGTLTIPGDGYAYHIYTTAGSEETLTNEGASPKAAV